MGAGILPISIHKSTLFLLLGQERHDNYWSDFGGSRDTKKKKIEFPFETAIREGSEEFNGLLGLEEDVKKRVEDNLISSIAYDKYTTYLFKMKHDKQLPIYFDYNNKFAEKHLTDTINTNHNGLYEKTAIKWFSFKELDSDKKREIIRPWYRAIVKSIVDNESIWRKEINKI